MKSLAKQAGKKTKTIEKMWGRAEKTVKAEYDIDEDTCYSDISRFVKEMLENGLVEIKWLFLAVL